jgi:hypothetical protein
VIPSLRGRARRDDLRYPRTQSVGLASAVQLGRDLFERADDDLATPSLLSVIWIKDSGARLDMVWRCEQGYEAINGWHNFGFAELIRVEIRPAPPSQPGHQ